MRPHVVRFGVILATLLVAACPKTASYGAYGLTSTGRVVAFKTNAPGKLTNSVLVSGLPGGQSVVTIKYRPADGLLYGVTSGNEVCEIDPVSGVATLIGGAAFDSAVLNDAVIAVDPVADQLRVLATDLNLQVSPIDGTLQATGTPVSYADGDANFGMASQLVGSAYYPAMIGASGTTLYGLDATTQSLVRIGDAADVTTNSANSGLLHTIGSLGTAFGGNAGFDIESTNGDAYAALAQGGAASALYQIDLGSGSASSVGVIGDGSLTIISMAIVPG